MLRLGNTRGGGEEGGRLYFLNISFLCSALICYALLCSALARGNNGQRSSVPCLLRPAGFAARLARLHPAPLGSIILLKLSFDSGVLSSSVALSSFSLNHRAGRAGAYYNMGFFRMAIIHVQPSLEMCHVFVCLLLTRHVYCSRPVKMGRFRFRTRNRNRSIILDTCSSVVTKFQMNS